MYFILGLIWFGLYNLINMVYPGSFQESGVPVGLKALHGTFLYFSMETLTTLGYGDIIPVHPVARMCATFESAAGILYIAITVARLVSSYQSANKQP